MTIRRNIDLSNMSDRLSRLQDACDNAPHNFFPRLHKAISFVGEQCDAFINEARGAKLGVCNCDGIREIESLMMNMLIRTAHIDLDAEIKCADFYGDALYERDSFDRESLIRRVHRDASLIKSISDWQIVVAESEVTA